MGSRVRRALRRSAVSTLVAALAPVLAGTAQAAIAGANPGTTPDRPDLVSAHILSSSELQVCFDKPVSSVSPGDFSLGGYAAGNLEPDTGSTAVDAANGNCVDAMYNASEIGDIGQYTIVDVAAGAVTYASTGLANHADSTTLAESSTHNGTTGLTTAPNLQSILAPTQTEINNNELVFQYDKAVDPSSLSSTGGYFLIWNAGAQYCYDDAESIVPNTNEQDVLVAFPSSCMAVTNAIQGESIYHPAAASDPAAQVTVQTAPTANAPNGGKPVYAPYMTGAKLDPGNPDGIIYTFNQNVSIGAPSTFCFTLSVGHAGEFCANDGGGQVSQLTPTTVEATFGGALSSQQEYAVQAQIYGFGTSHSGHGAVYTVQNGTDHYNMDQSAPIGDNASAFARGFTTGPDVTGVQMQSGSNALVTLDQRLCTVGGGPSASMCQNGSATGTSPVDLTKVDVYQGSGSDTPTHPSGFVVSSPDQSAGPQSVTLLGASGKFLQFLGCTTSSKSTTGGYGNGTVGEAAFEATLTPSGTYPYDGYTYPTTGATSHPCDPFNVDQIVQPIGTAAVAKATRAIRAELWRTRGHQRTRRHRSRPRRRSLTHR